ncbi:MAG TPA: hypothetical protein VGE98_15835, partial [Thermoanaerobaculia bacterium]
MGALSRTLRISLYALTILGLAVDGPALAQRQTTPRSIDDLLLAVADRVPSFGGMYLDANGHLAIYLTDSTQLARAESAITTVFGRDRFDVSTARAVRARYTFAQLKGWHDQHRLNTLAVRGVVLAGIHKATNRLRIGVESASVVASVQSILARYAIPSDAVEIVVTEPIRHWDKITDTHRPLTGGLFISTDKFTGCSLGFLAVLQGQAGFLTCSHCTDVQASVEGTIFHDGPPGGLGDSGSVVFSETGAPQSELPPATLYGSSGAATAPPGRSAPWPSSSSSSDRCA